MKNTRHVLLLMALSFGLGACAATAPVQVSGAAIGSGNFLSADGTSVRAVYSSNGTVTLTFADGASKALARAVSGSGARYTSGDAEWWEHQGQATYSVGGKQVFSGKLE